MSIDDQVGLVIADLRRAAIPGATGDAADRAADVLVDAGAQTGADRFAPSTAPLAVAVDGPGLFVLRDGDRTIYSRLGDFRIDASGRLVDGHGRTVVGFKRAAGGWAAAAMPIVVSADQVRVQENFRPTRLMMTACSVRSTSVLKAVHDGVARQSLRSHGWQSRCSQRQSGCNDSGMRDLSRPAQRVHPRRLHQGWLAPERCGRTWSRPAQ